MRYTIKDKSIIARGRGDYIYTEDYWGRRRIVGYYCGECGRKFALSDLEVDHIRPRSKRGSSKPGNLQLVCPRCNKQKGSKVPKKTTTGKKKTSTVRKKTSAAKRKRKT